MAEKIIGQIAGVLAEKVASFAANEISLIWDVKEEFGILERTMRTISAGLIDAESQPSKTEYGKVWIEDLQELCYQADDIMQEFEYEARRYKVDLKGKNLKKAKLFFSSSNQLMFRYKMGRKMRLLNQLVKQVVSSREKFNFLTTSNTGHSTDSAPDDSIVFGTDGYSSEMIEDNEMLPRDMRALELLKKDYNNFHPVLQRCFKFLSLYPEDCIIKKRDLIQLWMAEGLLGSYRPSWEMEAVGNEYFKHLLSLSYLAEAEKDRLGVLKSCKMHRLVHVLARSVARSDCLVKKVNKTGEEKIRHLRRVSLSFERDDFSPLPTTLQDLKDEISARPVNNSCLLQLFRDFKYVRVLDLSGSDIEELPQPIGKLKFLYYLNLTGCSLLRELPSTICALFSLQTLILKGCYRLSDLPKDMRKLTNLAHLILNTSSGWLPPMPKKVRCLTSLTCLPVFVAGNKEDGFGIEELRPLNQLSGKLKIYNLDNVRDGKDAQCGGLKDKAHLVHLELHWRELGKERGTVSVCDDFQVLEGLQPHRNVRILEIHNYAGSQFQAWMVNMGQFVPNLVRVVLHKCDKCEYLPSFGLLPFLKILKLRELASVRNIGDEFYGGNNPSVTFFPSLEYLSVKGLSSLEEWQDVSVSPSSSFPCLEELKVVYCIKLKVMPKQLPSLKKFYSYCCNRKPIHAFVENLPSLTSVVIEHCMGTDSFPLGLGTGSESEFSNHSLEELTLSDCGDLYFPLPSGKYGSLRKFHIVGGRLHPECVRGIECLPQLESLHIGAAYEQLNFCPFPDANVKGGTYFPALCDLQVTGWSNLECLPEQMQYIKSLETLKISSLHQLEALPEWLGNLVSLRKLTIEFCRNLKHLPSQEQMLRLTRLRKLTIDRCDELAKRCEKGGEEAFKISPKTQLKIGWFSDY